MAGKQLGWLVAAAFLMGGAGASHAAPAGPDGEYLTRAADCVACHTAEGGTPFAGGRPFHLPFGTIYSPNITPDRQTGIGAYTDDEWVAALREGIGRGGHRLYPAMPYTSYTQMTRGDALAIKAYLFTIRPVHAVAPANALRFPFNQRWGMALWNIVNNPDRRFAADPARPAEWNRGAYLVNALGHCGQCHTPRNWMYGLKSGQSLGGAQLVGWFAYNLTGDRTHGLGGWSDADLESYLSTGQAPGHGPASGPMAEAVSNSLRFLTHDDIHAMVVYLRSVPALQSGPEAVPARVTPAQEDPLGTQVFARACAGCHLPDGQGRQSPWAALAGDHSAGDPSGVNMLQILAHGSELLTATGQVFMHSFAGANTDEEIAAAARYVSAQFAGRASAVTARDVARAKGTGE